MIKRHDDADTLRYLVKRFYRHGTSSIEGTAANFIVCEMISKIQLKTTYPNMLGPRGVQITEKFR